MPVQAFFYIFPRLDSWYRSKSRHYDTYFPVISPDPDLQTRPPSCHETGPYLRNAGTIVTMDVSIHTTPLPHTDPEAPLAFYRDVPGFEVRKDVGSGEMRWITVGPPGQPGTSILLSPPATPVSPTASAAPSPR
jgi:hypothetical protein